MVWMPGLPGVMGMVAVQAKVPSGPAMVARSWTDRGLLSPVRYLITTVSPAL